MRKGICLLWAVMLLCTCLPAAAAVQHPGGNTVYNGMLSYSARVVVRETMETKKAAVADAAEMSAAEYAAYVRAALPSNVLTRPAYETEAARLGQIYAEDEDEEYAEKVLYALILTAQHYEEISDTVSKGKSSGMANLIPAYLVMAYDLVYNSTMFAQMDTLFGIDTRALIEDYFTTLAQRMYEENHGTYINNYGGFAVKNLVGTAWILDNPTIIRWAIALLDDIFAPSQWYADGMWSEGTTSYGQQMMGNSLEAINLLKLWDDPDGYEDSLLHLELHYTDLTSRWPIIEKAQQVISLTKYPNGTVMAMHDTHPSTGGADPTLSIQEQYLDNLELNHFGLYAMRHGTTAGAQQVELLFPPVAAGTPYGGGHGHGNYLALTYWAGGVELLPDAGYPIAGTEPNRFFHMNAVVHNESWITAQDVNYTDLLGQYTRPALLAYDDGTTSEGAVQLIEASQLMPEAQQNDVKRRALVTVAVDDTHFYTLDVQRLRGGIVHENFLRGSEDEAMDVTLSAPVSSTADNLGTQLKAEGKQGLMAEQTLFTDAQRGSAEQDMQGVWMGQQSGSSLHLFIKGVPDAEYALSSMPAMRQASVSPPHLYQRREVTAQDTTVFGAVYEGTYAGESAQVQNVQWVDFADSPMAVLAIVDLGDAEDWIYLSDDLTTREYEGVQFCGSTAVLRRSKTDGAAQWGYLYGEGSICVDGAGLYSAPDFTTRVTSAQGDTLTLEEELPAQLQGLWCMETFGDGTGLGHQMTAVQGQQVQLNNDAGYEITETGAQRTFYPAQIMDGGSLNIGNRDPSFVDWVLEGDVTIRVPQPVFGSLQQLGVAIVDAPAELQSGETYQVQALTQGTADLQLYAVVLKDVYADDSAHTWKKQEILSIETVSVSKTGGALMAAQTAVTLPQELETTYESGNVASRVSVRAYLWDENLAPAFPAGAWK